MLIGAIAVSLSGCSEGWSVAEVSAGSGLHPVRIEFCLGDAGLAVSGWTRAGADGRTFVPDGTLIPQSAPPRSILSSNNWQQVNDVRIYLFRKDASGEFVYYRPYDANGSTLDYLSVDDFSLKFALSPYVIWWGGDDDANEMHSYIGQLYLPDGEYRFLALARDDRTASSARRLLDPNIAASASEWTAWAEGTTRLETATLACARDEALSTTEFFSGCTDDPILVNGNSHTFSQTIVLSRAVAGLLLYVENIPATIPVYGCGGHGGRPLRRVPVRSLAVVHGKLLSDRVLVAQREAVIGRLAVTPTVAATASSADAVEAGNDDLPVPDYVLLRADIPAQAQVRNGIYVNLDPGNAAHPNALLGGSFVMPQQANVADDPDAVVETYDKTLYLVFLGYDSAQNREVALDWRPIRLSGNGAESCDPLYYPLLANHFYGIGQRSFSIQGGLPVLESDSPVDLSGETSATIDILLDPWWSEYYGGEIGMPRPGVTLDPEWGEHPGGEICE